MLKPFAMRLYIISWVCIFCIVYTSHQKALAHEPEIALSTAEKTYIETLKAKGGLRIATRVSDHIYHPIENGQIKGLYYLIAKDFADYFNLKLEINVVKWADYFNQNGKFPKQVRTDKNYVYTPDLIKKVDLYVDAFTLYPWREKIFTMIKFFPIKTMAITRKGEELTSVNDLKGKLLAVVPQSTYADTLREIARKLNTQFKYFPIKTFVDGLDAVSSGKADVTCMDSNDAWIARYQNLNMSIPLSDIQYICWIVKKDDAILASLLKKFFKYTMETGQFDKYWYENYNIPFNRYLKIIYLKNMD